MFCSQCGAQYPADAKFCPQCGNRIGPAPQPGTAPGPVAQPKQRLATWKKLLLGLAAGIACIVGLALYATSDLLVPIEAQLGALRAGNLQGAYEQTSSTFRQATSYAQFAAFVTASPGLSKNKETHFSERSWTGNQGVVKGTLVDDAGGVLPVEYRLVKENDQWKIAGITLK